MNDYGEMFYGTLPPDTQDFRQVLAGIGRTIRERATTAGQRIVESAREARALQEQAFGDPTRPTRVTDEAALRRLTDMIMAGPLGFAPMGMTANVTKQATTSLLNQPIQNTIENQLQKAFLTVNPGDKVSGLMVRKDVPNMGSIGASLDNYEVLEGIRNVPSKAFDKEYLDSIKAQGLDKRTADLSEQIKKSKEINPLIVAVDNKGAYIIEGGHRFDALMTQGRVSVPAKVVIDKDNPPTKEFLESLFK